MLTNEPASLFGKVLGVKKKNIKYFYNIFKINFKWYVVTNCYY